MAVIVLPLRRFKRSLRLLKVFDCLNSSMNHDAMSISCTSAYTRDVSLYRRALTLSLPPTCKRLFIALSQNATIWFQSLTFPTGKKANASLTSQIASLNGARKAKAPRCWTIAGCQVLDLIMSKSELNMNSPMESNANQDMTSLSNTGSVLWLAIRSANRPTCSRILGRYSAIAWVKSAI